LAQFRILTHLYTVALTYGRTAGSTSIKCIRHSDRTGTQVLQGNLKSVNSMY